jgi:hypothetical protein
MNLLKLQRPLAVVMITLVMVATAAPLVPVVRAQSSDMNVLVQQLNQQASVIGPTDPSFASLQQQFGAQMGMSGAMLAAAFQAAPQGAGQSYSGVNYFPLASAQNLDVRSVAAGQTPAALLGVLQFTASVRMGSMVLPTQLGIAVMSSPFAVVLIDLATGQIVAFVLLSITPILAVTFVPSFTLIRSS